MSEKQEQETAHWIIDFRGFGGTVYTWSKCGEVYCDIFEDVLGEEQCPNCGTPINDDENEYVE